MTLCTFHTSNWAQEPSQELSQETPAFFTIQSISRPWYEPSDLFFTGAIKELMQILILFHQRNPHKSHNENHLNFLHPTGCHFILIHSPLTWKYKWIDQMLILINMLILVDCNGHMLL